MTVRNVKVKKDVIDGNRRKTVTLCAKISKLQ